MPNSTLLKFNFLFGCILLFCFIFNNNAKAQNYTISRFDHAFCSNLGTPSEYVQASFSIRETSLRNNDGFVKGQTTAVPLILTLTEGFEFDPVLGSATVTSTGTLDELQVFGTPTISSDRRSLTVNISTGLPNTSKSQLNTLSFNNFRIRATGSQTSGYLARSGGTFLIDGTNSSPTHPQTGIKPSNSFEEAFARFTVTTPYVYQSNEVIQASIDSVTQYSIDNQILRVNIRGTGECGTSLTNMVFNTNGTQLPSNIINAKLYSTGNSSTFSTANYYGEVIVAPNGEFVIAGINNLLNGNNYFWLTYDIHGDASTATGQNKIDAQAVSFTLTEGSTERTITFDSGNPAGDRTIKAAEFYYSRYTGNWEANDMWSETLGGPASGKVPNGQGVVVISPGHTVNLSSNRSIDVIEVRDNALLNITNTLTINTTLKTLGSGRFTTNTALTINGHLELTGTGTSTSSNSLSVGGVLNVGAGTTLSKTNNYTITVNGNLIVNGNLNQSSGADIHVLGGTTEITGTGTITARTLLISTSNKTIPSSADLKIMANMMLGSTNARTITNRGRVLISGTLNGGHAESRWNNEANSTLIYQGATRMFTTGILVASSLNNTVDYNGGNQDVIATSGGQYHHLTLSGSGTKTQIDGVLRISGNFTNDVTFNAGASNQVMFNGSTNQIIGGTTATRFEEIGIDNTAGITLSNNIEVSSSINFSNGILITNSFTLTITNTATNAVIGAGAGKYVNGNLRKSFTSSVLTRNFEVGSNGSYTPVSITVAGLSTAGPLTVRSNDGDHAQISSSCLNHLKSVNKHWTISNSGLVLSSTGTYSATFTFVTGNTDSVANPGSFRVARYNAALSPVWATLTAGTSGTTTTQATGITTFGDFQIGELSTTTSVTIASTPSNATICAGETISFAISAASGLGTNPTYQWERKQAGTSTWSGISGATSTTYSSNTLANGDSIRLIATPGSSNCGIATAATSNAIGIIISSTITWTGATDNNWSTASNWCGNAVPTSAYDVVIPAGSTYYPEVNSSATVRSITIDENASLSVNASNSLTLTGSFTNNGQFTSSTLGSIQFSGTTSQVVGGNGNTQFGAILISNAAGVTLNQSITVAGNLNLQTGSINLNNNLLTLGENATITNADGGKYIVAQGGGFVQAPVALNKTIVFPIGTSSAYSPMEFVLKRATLTGGEYIQANVDVASSQGHPQLDYNAVANPIYLKRFWRLISSNTGGIEAGKDFGYDVKFTYLDSDTINTANKDESLITLGKYSNADVNNINGTWQAGGASIDTINNILAATGVSSFSSYTGAQLEMYDAIEPLPVNLLYFNAQPTGEEVELTWATAREENNDLFTIERSADGKNYSQVLQKDGSGNSNKRIDYKAYDRNPIKGLSYYRLKQTDFDGSFSYSAVVAVNFNGNKTTELVAYPNPSTGKSVGLIIKGLNRQKAIVKVTDLVGKTLYSQKVDILENNQEIIIDFATKLTPGSYTITITGNRNLLTTKLIVN